MPLRTFRRYLLDRMVLRPSRHPIDHAPKSRVMLSAGKNSDHVLECFVERNYEGNEAPQALVLKFPGTAGRAERATNFPADLLPNTRLAIWTWNPPGYGRSSGRASLARIAETSLEFWDQVTQRETDDSTTVFLCGNSLGCVTALNVAANVDHASFSHRCGLLLRNPPPLIPVVKQVASRYPLGHMMDRVAESLDDRMNAVVTAARVSMPAVLLQSELDTLVPPVLQQQVIDAYAGNLKTVTLEGLSHDGLADESHVSQIQDAVHWLWNQVVCLI